MRPHRLVVPLATALALVAALGPPVSAQAASSAVPPVPPGGVVDYSPPVDAPVLEGFSPPPPDRPWERGNRGIDFATAPGTPVRAMADGEIVFAGPVGGTLHVTVLHGDGLRTSYSFLVELRVQPGQSVRRGDVVGLAGPVAHVGARRPDDTYLDPASLWAGPPRVELVPGGDDGTATPPLGAGDQAAFGEVVRAAWRRSGLAERLRAAATMARWLAAQDPAARAARTADVAWRWHEDQAECTPPATDPPRPAARRTAVLVGGLGSSGAQAGIDRLDTVGLGYADADVVRFSYNGGRVAEPDDRERPGDAGDPPGGPPDDLVGVRDYTGADSQGALAAAAHRLATELRRLLAADPGTPLDVLAHSQGGLVARLALDELARSGIAFPPGSAVVTLGTPHRGADLATGLALVGAAPAGALALEQVHDRLGVAIDPASAAVRDLAEDSPTIGRVARARLPEGVALRSIAARGDLVVPNGRSRLERDTGRDVVVPLAGVHAHDELPADPAARREVALALAGLPPTCRSLATALADQAAGEGIAAAEQGVFLAAAGLLGAP